MAIEHINELDTLNAGREKINKHAIDPANRAELNSINAKSVANQANQTSQSAEAIAINTDDRLDNIIVGEMQDAEVIDARRPFGSETYATLGERLDSEKAEFSAQLAQITHLVTSYAIGDGETDDTQAIRQAITETSLTDGELKFPSGFVFKTTQQIVIPKNINVIMDSPIMYHGSEEITPLVVGNKNENITGKHYKLWVEKPYRNWNIESVGCKLYNCNHSIITLHRGAEFTTNYQLIGSSGKGFAYNTINIGILFNAKYQLHLTSEENGWCNENLFIGGRFVNSSVNQSGSRYGVRIGSLDGTYMRTNNNVFLKPSFELFVDPVGETVPILIESGTQNSFLKCRNEANGDDNFPFARIVGSNNEVELGYEDTHYASYVDATNISNRFIRPVPQYEDENKLQKDTLINEGVIGSRSTINESSVVTLPKNIFGWKFDSTKVNILRESNIIGNAVELKNIAFGIGVSIKNNTNRLHISPRFVSGKEGRIVFRPLDSDGNLILGITSFKTANAPYMYDTMTVQYRETYFNGCYMPYSNSGVNRELILTEDVDVLEIIFVGGATTSAEIEGFSVSDVYNPFDLSIKKSYAIPFEL